MVELRLGYIQYKMYKKVANWRTLAFVGAVLALTIVGGVAFALRSEKTTASGYDWPPLTMTYPVKWSSGGTPMTDIHRLTYTLTGLLDIAQEVISAEPIETHVGTFSKVGSYRKLENGQYTTYDAVTESTEVETRWKMIF